MTSGKHGDRIKDVATAKQLKRRHRIRRFTKYALITLIVLGGVASLSINPASAEGLWRGFYRHWRRHGFRMLRREREKKFSDTFSYLRAKGLITISKQDKQIYISLTPEGKRRAEFYQIDELEIKRQEQWDQKWRLIMFDVPEKLRIKRDALRGKLRELGFVPLQRSIWVYPYPCHDELRLLCDFFGFTDKNYILVETPSIGSRAEQLKEQFHLHG